MRLRFEYILLLLFTLFLILACWQPLNGNTDFWAHAAVGRWIVEHRQIPHTGLFLWTYNGPWTAHSWLAEIACYGIMKLGGESGGIVLAVVATTVLITLSFGIALWPIVKTGRLPITPAIVATAAVVAAVSRFNPRPELFTSLFLMLTCWCLSQDRAVRAPYLPLLFILWTNLHGGVLFGLAVVWATAICDLVQFKADAGSRKMALIALICSLAILINPYGFHYLSVFAPLENHSFAYINEWKPIWSPPDIQTRFIFCDLLVCIAAIAFCLMNPARRWAQIVWVIAGAAAFAGARRNMDLCALLGLFVFAWNYQQAASKWMAERSANRTLAIFGGIVAAGWLAILFLSTLLGQIFSEFALTTGADFPDRQVAFVQSNRLPGPVLNSYTTSAYLEWSLGDNTPLFIDELNAYPKSLFDQYQDIWSASPTGLAALDRLKIDTVIGQRFSAGEQVPALYGYLFSSPDWTQVYNGAGGPIFVRKSAAFVSAK